MQRNLRLDLVSRCLRLWRITNCLLSFPDFTDNYRSGGFGDDRGRGGFSSRGGMTFAASETGVAAIQPLYHMARDLHVAYGF